MSRTTINAGQGAAALIGITLGAIPLVRFWLSGTAASVWRLFGGDEGPAAWAGPLAVVVAALVTIVALGRVRVRR